MSRLSAAVRTAWPSGRAGYALAALLLLGIALRLVVVVSWWPVTTTLADSWPYSEYAATGPFDNPQHPAGYSLILATLGLVTREVGFPILIQHLAGIASALILFGAVRRVTGSEWAGLLPAGAVLLNPDLIYLEHSIMTESLFVLATSGAVYACCRTFDQPQPWYLWPLLAGVLAVLATMLRSAGLLLIGVVVVALLFADGGPRSNWRAAGAALAAAALLLLGFATANAAVSGRFGLGPSPGWILYGRVAQFADCTRFDVPPASRFLCEYGPAAERPGANYYLFDRAAPAPQRLGEFGAEDDLLREWAQRAIIAQPLDYLKTAWDDLRSYYVPSLHTRLDAGGGLDPQLDYTRAFNPADRYYREIQPVTERGMETFYNDFSVDTDSNGLHVVRALHSVTRFGGLALALSTVLVLIGLLVGSPRSRVGVFLFGLGGLSLLVAPALTGNYVGRYTVPMAGLMIAACAVAITALARGEQARRLLEARDAGRRAD